MPQETNFNVSPYFDDFDKDKEYYKVLFKPGFPVQARELTTSQSILQNQVEQIGKKFFKEGEIVIPGTISYENPIYAIQIDPTFNGLPISLYFNSLKNKKIKGSTSGVTAEIFELISNEESERKNYTLYVKYLESGGDNFDIKRFQDGEILILLDSVAYGENLKFTVQRNQGFANTLSVNSSSEGSAVSITEGTAFVRGIFTNIKNQTLILDQYSSTPTYKIGFDILERVVTSDEDDSLYDNARSFSNYTSPGADRFKVELILSKKNIDDIEIDNFVELMKVRNGVPEFPIKNESKNYNLVKNEVAKSISDSSGDFYVKPFSVYVRDSLNDRVLTNGIYFENQSTVSGNTPSEDKLVYQIGPGKAYVGGYEVETTSARLLDAPKTRTTNECIKEVLPYNAGTLFVLNNTIGSPFVGLGTNTTISLLNSRLSENKIATGTTIGVARVYDYIPESNYEDESSKMHLRLYDIQTYTKITLSKNAIIRKPTYVEGKKSNASGYSIDYSTDSQINSITFSSTGIGTIYFDEGTNTGITTIVTSGQVSHGLTVGDKVFISGTGQDLLDYQNNGLFSVLSVNNVIVPFYDSNLGIGTTTTVPNGTGFTIQLSGGVAPEDPSSISGLGNFTNSSSTVTVNSPSHPFSTDDEIYIENTSNNKFNNSFKITKLGANTFRLNGVTALNYYDGPVSSIDGTATLGITTIRLYEVSGRFNQGELITFNGTDDSRIIKEVIDYSISDVKSVYVDSDSGISTFSGDLYLGNTNLIASPGTIFRITSGVSGISTISSSTTFNFADSLQVNDIISYINPYKFLPVFNKVVEIGNNGKEIKVVGISTVNGVCDGGLFIDPVSPSNFYDVTNITKLTSSVYGSNNSETLMTKLSYPNVASLDLENNTITQRRLFSNVSYSNNTLNIDINPEDDDVYFSVFDEDRYVITYTNGEKEIIRFDRFTISNNGKRATFVDLKNSPSSSGYADVIATVVNYKPNSKIKKLNRASTIVISNSKLKSSGLGDGTKNDGLTYSNVYGTRVQDKEISLNIPDAIRVLGIYESTTTDEPKLPSMQVSGNLSNLIIGEWFVGEKTGSVGLIIKKIGTDLIEYVHLNSFSFEVSENILFKESNSLLNIVNIFQSDKNITQNYSFDDGQRSTYYDYSRIVKKKGAKDPEKKIKIVFQNYTVDSSDTGEFFTVNSYANSNFKHDILSFNSFRLTDYIDIRPRVSPYVLNDYSPFEFNQRSFNGDGQYSKYILAPGENLQVCYNHYLGRIDKICLKPNGSFEVVQGIPASLPTPPALSDNCLEIATVNLPPYVYNVDNIEVDFTQHKKYTMKDISFLEDRIKRLEEYTVLNSLEIQTENLSLKDAETGLDRFKCGFFVDAFINTDLQDFSDPNHKVSLDSRTKTLRPSHYTTSLDMQLGSEVILGVSDEFDQTKDHDFVSNLGSSNIKKTGDLITLNYSDVLYFEQPYATRTESVTPFLVKYWTGSIELRPPMDSWIEEREETNRAFTTKTTFADPLPDINITVTNNIVENRLVFRENVNTRTGIANNIWITNRSSVASLNLWWQNFRERNTNGLNTQVITSNGQRVVRFQAIRRNLDSSDENYLRSILPIDVANNYITQVQNSNNRPVVLEFTPNFTTTTTTNASTSTSVRTTSNTITTIKPPEITVEDTQTTEISNYTQPIRYLRSRNIEFDVKGLRPRTKFYAFFEGIDVNTYVIPKLLEIDMISGRFQVGETVETDPHFTSHKIRFRVCKPNHKTGPFSNPIEKFTLIPYTQQSPPDNYTESSTYLNVDTRSLELSSEVDYYGRIAVDMKIIGKTSGAVARIKTNRLISDNVGRLIGSLYIPDPKIPGNPRWINGENTFTIIDVPSLSSLSSNDKNIINESSAERDFSSTGNTNVTQKTLLTTRNIKITPSRNINTTTITNTTTNTTTITQTEQEVLTPRVRWEVRDPLAQSFYVPDETGIFLTGVDVYFETKDDSIPVTLQIREMIAGVPSNVVLPFSEVTLVPDEINTSITGTLSTRFTFSSPVYLPGPKPQEVRGAPVASEQTAEYAIVLLSNSSNYRVFISQLGETDILTNVKVGAQPTLGSLFKSQNGTTWTPSQLQDLKYKVYRANFVNQGVVRYFNPVLSLKNNKISVLGENQIETISKKQILRLNIEPKSSVVPGVTILQENKCEGILIGVGGSISSGLGVTITNSGIGYTPTSGSYIFENKELITESGYGVGALADITVTDGNISNVDIISGGFGYQFGDSLLIPSIGQDVGFGAKVSVSNISLKNSLIVDNIVVTDQSGSYFTQNQSLLFKNEVGLTTQVGFTTLTSEFAYPTQVISDNYYDGKHLKINCLNHGMHSSQNYVRISNLRPKRDSLNTKLTSTLSSTETTSIIVDSSSGFETFEGFPVSNDNPGYLVIGSEVVGYTTVSNSITLGGLSQSIQRGIDGSESQPYETGVPVYKYELNGISLRRINKIHSLSEVEHVDVHNTTLNSFHVKIERSSSDFESNPVGVNRGNTINFTNSESLGESGTMVSNNIPFELITPNFATIVPSETSLNAKIRTFSGTSIDGNEDSFEDQGYEDISLESAKQFSTPRLIASAVNESRMIENSPGNRSLTMEFNMSTNDSRVSPVIDDVTTSVILTSNIINAPAGVKENSIFSDVEFVRGDNDKHDCIYISKPISLKLPANSLKVILKSSTNENNDIRVLYKLIRTDSSSKVSNFELFPGYLNYQADSSGIKRVIDASKNDGSSDEKDIVSSDETFKELEYTIDNLPEFNAFAIKIILASKNQAKPPLVKDLRAIATLKPQI